MATKAFFINETYLKENSPLSGNVDIAELYPFARTAEKIYIQEAIGQALYDDLVTKIIADNDLSGYPNELILVKKIREAVLWYTVYDALPFLSIKIRNTGVVKQTGEGHESASGQDVKELRHECKTKGDFFLKVVQEYLCYNKSLFSAYQSEVEDEIRPDTSSPTPSCDIAFGNGYDSQRKDFSRKWGGF